MKTQSARTTFVKSREGATALEFALVMPVFMILVMGIFDFGRYCYLAHIHENALREIARLATVNTSNPSFPMNQNDSGILRSEYARLTGVSDIRTFYVCRCNMNPGYINFIDMNWKNASRDEYIVVYADFPFKFTFGYTVYLKRFGFTKSEAI